MARERSRLVAALLRWYDRAKRDLPWRRDPTPYRVWVSEVMLQQTRVETVIPYYQRFLERFPTVEALAAAPLDEVLARWSGLGYYRRARSLHEGARVVVERLGGAFPRDAETALTVPGVGPYTAGAVLGIAYGLPVPVVDGNVERVVCRLLRLPGDPGSARVRRTIREAVDGMIPRDRVPDFSQALMELGAVVCRPVAPACDRCPLSGACRARDRGDAERFPEKPARRASVSLAVVVLVVRDGDLVFVERRPEGGLLGGLWLFPARVAPSAGRSAADAGCRAILDGLTPRLAAGVSPATFVGEVRHSITFRRIRAAVFQARGRRRAEDGPRAVGDGAWVRLADLGRAVPVSSLTLKVAALLDVPRGAGTPAPQDLR